VSQDGWDNHDANGNEIEWEKKGWLLWWPKRVMC
jgi:hypothetical protein